MGLRPTHYSDFLAGRQELSFLEVISENFMFTHGRPRRLLHKFRQDYPVALHGVSLSIASTDDVDLDYLKKLKQLVDEVQPFVVSDHLCWSGQGGIQTHDLLPVPLTTESLNWVVQKVNKVQDYLKRPIMFENIAHYVSFAESTLHEAEFINELCDRTGCKLLLDLNNVYVNSVNFHFNPVTYLEAIDKSHVAQYHISGPTDLGDFLFDTHVGPIPELVWLLYRYALAKISATVPALIEWDSDIPSLQVLLSEVKRAEGIFKESKESRLERPTLTAV